MIRNRPAAAALLACLTLGTGLRVEAEMVPPSSYMAQDAIDLVAILPAAPRSGDARYEADRVTFRATRTLVDTPRWHWAVSDVSEAPADMLRNYACAAGIELTPARVPVTTRLLVTAAQDTARANNVAKRHFQRQRPFLIDHGPICQPAQEVTNSFDYPSGHTTLGWTWALILAELLPDRATSILARGRAYGESRIVCGVHNASAVEAGRLSATLSLTPMRAAPAFQADLAAARAELAALGNRPVPSAERCRAEADALSVSPLQ
ncbi:acid phosphatase [Niveispirillum sp. KHB5.9]|uniref:acid phosphatase n=1 Tax=Niveispirillum sp. KHB5.9 TaxID=3400269 RepID=UPI003A8B2F2B